MKIFSFGSNKGVSLVEVMIALMIIALVMLGGGMFFFYGRVTIIREAHRRAALLVASQILEELKAADYDGISDTPAVPVDVDNLSEESNPYPTMVTEVEYVDDDDPTDSDQDYKKVTVIVNWHDGTSNSVSLTTLIAPR